MKTGFQIRKGRAMPLRVTLITSVFLSFAIASAAAQGNETTGSTGEKETQTRSRGTSAGKPSPRRYTKLKKAPPTSQGIPGATTAVGIARNQGQTAAASALRPGTLEFGNGITMFLNYTGEVAGNPVGGIRQGSAYAGQIFFGIDGNLEQLAGIEGGSAHVVVTQRHGRDLTSDYIGSNTSVQEVFGGGQTARLSLLSYEQKLFDNHFDVEVGRLPAQGSFFSSPVYCNFQNNGICGSPTFVFKDSNFTYFPVSTWGAHAKFWLDDDFKYFLHVGAYEVNPRTQLPTDNGIDWSTKGATGFHVPIELGYSTTFANDAYPRNYGIGAVIDQSHYSDPILDTAGSRTLFSGLDPLTRFGRSFIFARFDQMIWRPDLTAPQGLTVFGLAMKGTGGRQIEDYYLAAGLVQTGTFDARPYDTVAAMFSLQKFSSLGLADVRAARTSLGLDSADVATTQYMLEVNYGIQLTPAIRITPNLQYIVNPDQTRYPFRAKSIPNAFVIGTKLSVDLFTLAGLAKGIGQ
ncbi:carbohydrate porin [Methylobacterium brachythecii]|nr:carbohydrate porin [Methylobacterium brachythecii]